MDDRPVTAVGAFPAPGALALWGPFILLEEPGKLLSASAPHSQFILGVPALRSHFPRQRPGPGQGLVSELGGSRFGIQV